MFHGSVTIISPEPYNLKTWNLYRRTQQAICICSMPLNIHAFNTLNCICFQKHSNKLICFYRVHFIMRSRFYDWMQQGLRNLAEPRTPLVWAASALPLSHNSQMVRLPALHFPLFSAHNILNSFIVLSPCCVQS